MRPYAIAILAAVALILMVLNLYGIYELVVLFTRIRGIKTGHSVEKQEGDSGLATTTPAYDETTSTQHPTTKHHGLKYKFNRTTGMWERRPVEVSTHRPTHSTTYRTRHRPTTSRKYYFQQESTTPPTTTLPPAPETTIVTRRRWPEPDYRQPATRRPIIVFDSGADSRPTTRMPFRINTIKITTHRDDLVTSATHHHRQHHNHRHHHHHTTTTTTTESTTVQPSSTTIFTHRNSVQWYINRHTTTLPPPPPPTTTTTVAPETTTVHQHHHHHHEHRHHHNHQHRKEEEQDNINNKNNNNNINNNEDGIVIEREDLISTKNDDEEYDVAMPSIHVSRGDLPTVPSTTSKPLILIDDEGSTLIDRKVPEVTSVRPTTTSVDEDGGMTVVTALMDIGRGEWFEYRRPLEKYHSYMENVLSLKVNMVIFTDKSSVDFVHKYRAEMGLMHKTKIYNITLEELPLYRYLFHAQKIIEDELKDPELWRSWDPQMQKHPEAKSPEYDVLVNSKTYFLYNATLDDPFSSDWFVWLDAGYGHGDQTPFPVDNNWRPQFPRRQISVIKVTPEHDKLSNWSLEKLYRHNWSVISGGFLAGERHAIGQLHTLVHRKFVELINMDRVDDDQTVLVLVIKSHPHLFNVITGDWFDAFAKFPSIK